MTLDAVEIATLGGVRHKHETQEISGLDGNVVGEGELGADDVLVEQVDIVTIWIGGIVIKGEVTCEHGVEDYTTRPDVDG